jgi:O-antigen ligase
MRRVVLPPAIATLLAGPTVLAFFSGGYFDAPRLIAAVAAWALVLAVALAAPQPLPASWRGRVALAGLVLIAAWTGLSIVWAPLSGPATAAFVRLLLYVATFVAAMALLREPAAARFAEPALALGVVVVIGYALAGRLLPGIVHLSHSLKAGDRLEQPLTYWNAEGALAAMGLVLVARLAGAPARPRWLRLAAAAAAAPLGLGVYLSYSRGAIAAAVVGLIILVAAAPSWAQLRAVVVAAAGSVVAAAVAAALPGVASLEGGMGHREAQGAIMLAVLVAVMAAAAAVTARSGRRERSGRLPADVARRLPALAGAAVALALVGLVIGGLGEKGGSERLARSEAASRLTSVESRRYDYWRIGWHGLSEHPLRGLGAAGFRVLWLRKRPVLERTLDVHSLELEMAVELGLLGLLGLGLLVGGVAAAGAEALRRGALVAPGAAAAASVFLLHASIDWDWEMPAVALPALMLAAALVAASESPADQAA